MATVKKSHLKNGLDLYRIGIGGTKATTVLVAFDAGARTEDARENGVAHFLEHLVFKGGKSYPTPRAINSAAEGIGAVLNAYTSHDLVAFHITCRAERVVEACDLLTDFVARPKIAPEDIDRERGVVIQEIARAHDQPSRVADDLMERAIFSSHPLGRAVLGPARNIKSLSREQIQAFRKRQWGTSRAAAFVAGNVRYANAAKLGKLFNRFPARSKPPQYKPAVVRRRTLVTSRDTNQSHLRLAWEPLTELSSTRMQAAFTVYATLLGGSMGSRLFDEIREQRGLCYSISAYDYVNADVAMLYVSSGLQSRKCIEAYGRIGEIVSELAEGGPTESEFERAKAFATGKAILAFESTGMVARYAASEVVVQGADPDPQRAVKALERVKLSEVAEVAAAFKGSPALACVGPHTAKDFKKS